MKNLLVLLIALFCSSIFRPIILSSQVQLSQAQCDEQSRSWNTFPKGGYLKGYSRYSSRTIDSLPFLGKTEYVDSDPLQESRKFLAGIEYPYDEKRLGIEALFRLVILVSEQGKLGEIFVECADGIRRQEEFQHFFHAIQKGLEKKTLVPAVKNGKNVAAWVRVSVPFRLR